MSYNHLKELCDDDKLKVFDEVIEILEADIKGYYNLGEKMDRLLMRSGLYMCILDNEEYKYVCCTDDDYECDNADEEFDCDNCTAKWLEPIFEYRNPKYDKPKR